MNKICSKCKIEKNINDFWKSKRSKDGRFSSCKKCQQESNYKSQIKNWGNKYAYHTQWRRKLTASGNASIIYSKKKYNAKQKNILFDITLAEFSNWYLSIEKKCYYCGIKQENISNNKDKMPTSNKHRLTLDRKNNNAGYIKGNIVLACSRCNLIKSNFFTEMEMIEIGERYVKQKWD